MDLADLDWGASFGGLFVLFQLAMAVAAWVLLAGRPQPLRIVAAVIAFLFPAIAVIGLVLWFKLRGRLGAMPTGPVRPDAQPREAASRAERKRADAAQAQVRTPPAGSTGHASLPATAASTASAASSGSTSASMDIAKLMSSDLSVRFGATLAGERKLNIPRVVE